MTRDLPRLRSLRVESLLRGAWAGVMAAGALGFTACGSQPCPVLPTGEDEAPVVAFFDVADQFETDPWMVIFEVHFSDADGDLRSGRAELFLDGQTPATAVPLDDLFRQSGLGDDATQGKLGMPIRFHDTVRDGASVGIGIQLVDEAGRRSNCFSLRLTFEVGASAARVIAGPALACALNMP